MRKWTLQELQQNLRKRFGDRNLFVEQEKGQIRISRRPPQAPNRKMTFLKLSSLASKDYILLRMYQMDTSSKTLVERDLDQDKTEERIEKYEKRKEARRQEELMRREYLKKKRQGKARFLC